MAKRTWTFWLEGRIHTIELEHGSFSGRRVISVDGRELERSQRLFDTGSEHTFSLDGHDVTVYIHTNGFTFRYGLEIDGMPVKGEGEEIRVTHAATPLAKARDQAAVTVVAHALMVREIRSWGFWLLGLGALHLVLSGFLSAPWGILLGVVGLASFIFHDSAMFVVYGTTLVWAAIVNLTAGSARWAAFAVLQGYLVVRVFRQFFRFRRVERDYPALAPEGLAWDAAAGRAQRLFPWLGCLLGLLTLGGACGLFMALILVGEGASATALDLLVEGVVNLGVLALAVSLGSLLAGYRYRFLAALGVASSALVIIPTLILVFVAAFSRGVNPQFP